ncbi:MAG: cytochrome-c peroxidase [Planctomycetota bacterium]
MSRALSSLSCTLAIGLVAAGCSGGGGGGSVPTDAAVTAAPAPPPPAPPPSPPPPPPPPNNNGGGGAPVISDVDAALRTSLQNDGIRTPVRVDAESADLVALGRALFFDKELSGNRNISCATCHQPTAGTGDGLPLSLGEGAVGTPPGSRTPTAADQAIARNAPGLFNTGARGADRLFWDGRVQRDPDTGALTTPEPVLNGATPARPDLAGQLTSALAAQAMFPPTSAEEMRGDPGDNELADATDNVTVWARIMARLVGTSNGTVGGIAGYRALFQAAYPTAASFDELTFAHAARAIAAFEAATFAYFDAPLDRFLAGDDAALSEAAKRGGLLFTGRARCANCHRGPLLTDERFHAIAFPQLGPGKDGGDDRGRALITGDANDAYRFRTPGLRNVARTGPWTHAGAYTSLQNVLRHYRNPDQSLLDYDPNQLPALFRPLVDTDLTRNQARLVAIDPRVGTGIPMNNGEIDDIIAFLEALSDPAAATPTTAPASVPSGLPVAD